ncbi:hypothetical protein AMECASPLE_013263 [Ameca splendens]|uniref:50S ribosomal protein L6 n=1 Tax=Ameca splendens TaxID=208324 RepID=A0ABV0Y1A3_9TELE
MDYERIVDVKLPTGPSSKVTMRVIEKKVTHTHALLQTPRGAAEEEREGKAGKTQEGKYGEHIQKWKENKKVD